MNKKLYATPALATLVALPIAGYVTFTALRDMPPTFGGATATGGSGQVADKPVAPPAPPKVAEQDELTRDLSLVAPETETREEPGQADGAVVPQVAQEAAPAESFALPMPAPAVSRRPDAGRRGRLQDGRAAGAVGGERRSRRAGTKQ